MTPPPLVTTLRPHQHWWMLSMPFVAVGMLLGSWREPLASVRVASRAKELRDAWSPSGGDFLARFSKVGADDAAYPTTQEALNAVSDALFYLDKETKDMKLAIPAGLKDCTSETCPPGATRLDRCLSRFAPRWYPSMAAPR